MHKPGNRKKNIQQRLSSELRAARQAKILSDSYLENIINNLPHSIIWKDHNSVFLGCNQAFADSAGFKNPKDIVGKTDFDMPWAAQASLYILDDQEVIKTSTPKLNIEEPQTFPDGRTIFLSTSKVPLLDEQNKTIGVLAIYTDVTHKKNIENTLREAKEIAENANHSKSQFLAVVNHELRTPLSSIIGLVKFLKQGNLSLHEEEEVVDALESCTLHLLNLVNDMLDFSKLEASRYRQNVKLISLAKLSHEVYSIINNLAEEKGLQFEIDINPNTPTDIMSDARVLRQILINLLSNAIKFTEKGRISLHIQALQVEVKKAQLEVTVTDSGMGIAADKLNLIFEPFQQLEDAYTRQSSRSGTGLGLTIVKKLTAIIGASLHVSSEPGKGSAFSFIGTFDLPEHKPNQLTPPTKAIRKKRQKVALDSLNNPNFSPRKIKILLVEDDPIVQFVHKKMLMDLGCEVCVVSNGNDAIKSLNNHDLMFVDISLPDITGFEVIKATRALNHAGSKVPIIALTVYTGKEEKTACLEAGADAFASKPISPAMLQKLLAKHTKAKENDS